MQVENNKNYLGQTELIKLYGLNYDKAKQVMEHGRRLKVFQIRITKVRIQRHVIHILQEEAEQILESINKEPIIKKNNNEVFELQKGMIIVVGEYNLATPYIEHSVLNKKTIILDKRVDDLKNEKLQKWSIKKPQVDLLVYCSKRMIECVVKQKKESLYIDQIKAIIIKAIECHKLKKEQVFKLVQATKGIEQERLIYMFHKIWIDLIVTFVILKTQDQCWVLARNDN